VVVLDAELTACDAERSPDFGALLRKRTTILCVRVFDVFHNGKDLRPLTYVERRQPLESMRAKSQVVRYSETFPDWIALLSACQTQGLAGIVSKRIDKPYRSGPSKRLAQGQMSNWREHNQWRHDFFARQNPR
jgi:bifunctional non-homologous end joining protein LigD